MLQLGDMSQVGEFGFTRPDASERLSPAANLIYGVGALASRMVQVERTICNHPGGRAENDAEHSYMLALVATSLAEEYFPELDSGLVSKYSNVHDLPESYVGDTPTHVISAAGLQAKADLEADGLRRLVEEYKGITPKLVKIMQDYEAQADPESRFVRMVDKLLTVSIQFPDGGETIVRAMDRRGHEDMVRTRIQRFSKNYPDQKAVLDLYDELAEFMRSLHYPPDGD